MKAPHERQKLLILIIHDYAMIRQIWAGNRRFVRMGVGMDPESSMTLRCANDRFRASPATSCTSRQMLGSTFEVAARDVKNGVAIRA
jgi:hypothetical protein